MEELEAKETISRDVQMDSEQPPEKCLGWSSCRGFCNQISVTMPKNGNMEHLLQVEVKALQWVLVKDPNEGHQQIKSKKKNATTAAQSKKKKTLKRCKMGRTQNRDTEILQTETKQDITIDKLATERGDKGRQTYYIRCY